MASSWIRGRWPKVLLGLVVGAVAGLAVYQGSQLTGRSLFVLCGATAGTVAAVVIHGYSRSVRLTDISVGVPQFSKLHFAVTKSSQDVAWKLFVESVTRVSTQPLDTGRGLVREALTSLYGLFAIVRDILKDSRPSAQTGTDPTVEHLGIAMLNIELRPFLSRWHPVLRAWEKAHPDEGEAGWPDDAQCRADLVAMQSRLREYILGFGKLAGVPNAAQIVEGTLGPRFQAAATSAPRQNAPR